MEVAVKRAKPTSAQLTDRIYRKVLAIEKIMADAALIHVDNKVSLEALYETMRTLTHHCERLLKEKETLAARCDALEALCKGKLTPLDTWQWRPGHGWKQFTGCNFAHLHTKGIRCAVCNWMEMPEDSYVGKQQ
jgi:hypothetical protein